MPITPGMRAKDDAPASEKGRFFKGPSPRPTKLKEEEKRIKGPRRSKIDMDELSEVPSLVYYSDVVISALDWLDVLEKELQRWIDEEKTKIEPAHDTRRHPQRKPSGKCQICGEKIAISVCLKCGRSICKSCHFKIHHIIKLGKNGHYYFCNNCGRHYTSDPSKLCWHCRNPGSHDWFGLTCNDKTFPIIKEVE